VKFHLTGGHVEVGFTAGAAFREAMQLGRELADPRGNCRVAGISLRLLGAGAISTGETEELRWAINRYARASSNDHGGGKGGEIGYFADCQRFPLSERTM